MTETGFTKDGFIPPTAEEILDQMRTDVLNLLGFDFRIGDATDTGAILATITPQLSTLWQQSQRVFQSQDVETATGIALDQIVALLGITRQEATATTVTLTLSGNEGVVVEAGKQVRTDQDTYTITTTVTIGAGGTVDTTAQNDIEGARPLEAGATWAIITPVAGWDSVSNAAAGVTGEDFESDNSLRSRYLQSLQAASSCTDDAIRAAVLEKDFVQQCRVISNRTQSPGTGGALPGEILTVVWPNTLGTEQKDEVGEAIYRNTAAGSGWAGAETYETTTDSDVPVTVRWSFASEVTVDVVVNVTTTSEYPADGDQQVEASITELFSDLKIDEDVSLYLVQCAAGIKGVIGATATLNGSAADVPVSSTSIATLGTVTVNS